MVWTQLLGTRTSYSEGRTSGVILSAILASSEQH